MQTVDIIRCDYLESRSTFVYTMTSFRLPIVEWELSKGFIKIPGVYKYGVSECYTAVIFNDKCLLNTSVAASVMKNKLGTADCESFGVSENVTATSNIFHGCSISVIPAREDTIYIFGIIDRQLYNVCRCNYSMIRLFLRSVLNYCPKKHCDIAQHLISYITSDKFPHPYFAYYYRVEYLFDELVKTCCAEKISIVDWMTMLEDMRKFINKRRKK